MATICPVCKQKMVTLNAGRIDIDFCRNGCKGLWFDARELQVVDASHKGFDDVLAEALAAKPRIRHNQPIPCPHCRRPLHQQGYRNTGVLLDACYLCGGFFLDSGELQQIRELTQTKRVQEFEKAKRLLMAYKPPSKIKHAWGCKPMVTHYSSDDIRGGMLDFL